MLSALKSLIMRTVDIDHPFQGIADEIVEVDDPEGILDDFFSYDGGPKDA